MSGARYLKSDLGPLPGKWYDYLTPLIDRREVDLKEVFAGEDIAAERLIAKKRQRPDSSLLENAEPLILTIIRDRLRGWSVKSISNRIRDERGYIEILERGMIPDPLAAN